MAEDLLVRIDATTAGYEAGLARAQAATMRFETALRKTQLDMARLETSMNAELEQQTRTRQAALRGVGDAFGAVGLAAAVGVGLVVKQTMDFDSAMSEVEAATRAGAQGMGDFRQAALDFGQSTRYSATEAAGAITELAKAGVSNADILGGALKGSLNLAAAAMIDVSDAAGFVSVSLNQFGLSGGQASHVADVLAAAAGKATGEVSDIAEAMKYVGPIANQMGISIEETAGSVAYLAQQGILGSQAGTSLRGILATLSAPSKEAATEMERLGLNVFDTKGNFIGFNGVAEQLQQSLKGATQAEVQHSLGLIFTNQQLTAANLLYQGGGEAIDRWTGKVTDADFASEQAAIKMDNLAGDLEQLRGAFQTAFIGTGDASQGPLRELVQTLTDLVNAYNKLPGPVKTAAFGIGSLTAVLGLGTFAAARLINAYIDLNRNLADLEGAGVGAAGKMATLARAAGVAAIAIGSMEILGSVVRSMDDAAPSADHLARALVNLTAAANAKTIGDVTTQLGDLRGSIETLADPNLESELLGAYDKVPVIGSNFADIASSMGSVFAPLEDVRTGSREAAADLDSLDRALAGLVAGGSADQAKASFDALARQYGLTADEQKTLMGLLPQYSDALDASATSAKLAKNSTDGMGDAMGRSAKKTKALEAALKEAQEAGKATADEFLAFGDDLDDASVSLDQFLHHMQQQSQALRQFRENAELAASKGLDKGLILKLNEAGPTGALRMKQIAHASQDMIRQFNAAFQSGARESVRLQVAIGGIATAVEKVPNTKTIKMYLDGADNAFLTISRISAALNAIRHNVVEITTIHTTGGRSLAGNAEGGTIEGQRFPYGDRVLTMLAPGEEVISNRHGQADRYRADRASGRIPRYATGGTVGHYADGGTAEAPEQTPAQQRAEAARRAQAERERRERIEAARERRDQAALAHLEHALERLRETLNKQQQHPLTPDRLLRRLNRPEDTPDFADIRKGFHAMKLEVRDVARAERDLYAARMAANNGTRQVADTERQLERARGKEHKDKDEIRQLENRLEAQRKNAKVTDKDLERAEKDLSKQRDQLTSATDKWKAAQQALIDQAAAIRDTVLGTGSIFGGTGEASTAQGLRAKLADAANQAETFDHLLHKLRRRHLDRDIVQQLIDEGPTPEAVALAQSLARAPASLINRINAQQHALEAAANQIGLFGVGGRGRHHRRHHHGHGGSGAGGDVNYNTNFNGPVTVPSVKRLATEITRKQQQAVRVAGGA